jgi:transcriptional regulator with XRE-family HTH domain
MTIAKKIRARRAFLGLSLADVAERADLSPSTLSRIERGLLSPRLETVERLARALGYTAEDLLLGDRHA